MSWSLTILFCVLKLWKFSAASFWLMQFWQVLQFQWLILPSVKVSSFVMAGSSFMDHQFFVQNTSFSFCIKSLSGSPPNLIFRWSLDLYQITYIFLCWTLAQCFSQTMDVQLFINVCFLNGLLPFSPWKHHKLSMPNTERNFL